jgi:hypothetical protein
MEDNYKSIYCSDKFLSEVTSIARSAVNPPIPGYVGEFGMLHYDESTKCHFFLEALTGHKIRVEIVSSASDPILPQL